MRRETKRYPLEEVLRLAGSQNELARRVGVDRATVVGWVRRGGLPEDQADRVAVTFGVLPFELWPEWLHVEVFTPEERAARKRDKERDRSRNRLAS